MRRKENLISARWKAKDVKNASLVTKQEKDKDSTEQPDAFRRQHTRPMTMRFGEKGREAQRQEHAKKGKLSVNPDAPASEVGCFYVVFYFIFVNLCLKKNKKEEKRRVDVRGEGEGVIVGTRSAAHSYII